MIFRSINFYNRGIKRWQNINLNIPGTLLFPFGNLSRTSILYYMSLYIEVEYNFKDRIMDKGNVIDKSGYYSIDDSYIDNLWS
jgi:hypothetical protein